MPPLTSPSGCVSCASLAVKILELEGRISTLYKIPEAKKHLDTIVFKPAQSDTSSGLQPDPTAPTTAAAVSTSTPEPAVTAHSPAGESASPSEPVTTHGPAAPPLPISDDCWARFGAKPKGLQEREEFPSGTSWPTPTGCSSSAPSPFCLTYLSSEATFTSRHPSPPAAAAHQRAAPPPRSSGHSHEKLAEQRSGPSPHFFIRGYPATKDTKAAEVTESADPVLVIGSSMVRHVCVDKCRTSCHPGALVSDVRTSVLRLLRHCPSVSTVVIHAGSNDLKLEQSEKLKVDFISLIDSVLNSNKQCVISSPIPSSPFGDVKYSRLRQLHIWLKDYCCNRRIPYVDNFTTFFKRPDLFKHDRLHLNYTGSRLLSTNIDLTLHSCKAFIP
ncbi:uncharacterized protein LOC121645396 isoform X1 [Xyrichtys novacula]|uniref:Uncharacterized protein LOC121645396 isoform X1 n=1 Tax=Xyrichtys novacula TaxID=13765 RepID=A0AAV1GC26_XYRNO|nr:uncharacterized protein LOC121645396 isoform X1 [Xyrichtys novacula]